MTRFLLAVLVLTGQTIAQPVTLRVATFNVEDLRTEDLEPASPRARSIAAVIQRVRPNILLINEIAYDTPGVPPTPSDAKPGQNAERFAKLLARPVAPGLKGLSYKTYMGPTNTGMPSGFDLDNNGETVTTFPTGNAGDTPLIPRTEEGNLYANDCWGYGTFPGQYAMALLVDSRLDIDLENIRTFQRLPWSYMPGARRPRTDDGGEWFTDEEWQVVRLSSKSHWDVPVRLPGGAVVHILASHPTPPAFDGPEQRNKRRNHDEIRFWADYISGDPYIVDDNDTPGGLAAGTSYIVMGDLNADPDEGSDIGDPIDSLLAAPRMGKNDAPRSDIILERMDSDDTARFRLRVDYVLPSKDIEVIESGVWRKPPANAAFPSDHFPVWADIRVPVR